MLALDRTFHELLKKLNLKEKTPVAVACSGGPDSLALALLAHGWAKAHKHKIVALTVDHGLRKESAKEAKQVGAWLKKQGIAHAILNWKGRKPRRNIQEAARKARYGLMAEYCKTHNISHLLVAHHLEDQAETFLLRLARGSGVDGLSAMATLTDMYDVKLVRPLLSLPKTALLEYLAKRKQPFVKDPSNENPAFDRVKIRGLLPTLAEVGISADRLAKTATIMARARAHLEEETGRFLSAACTIAPEGYARLQHLNASEEIGLRALATLIMIIGGNDIKTRMSELDRLYTAVREPGFKGATLGGCVFARHKGTTLIYRELKAAAKPSAIKPGVAIVWDNRFEVTLTAPRGVWRVGALTQSGWLSLSKAQKLKNPFANKQIIYSLPCIRDLRGRIISVPHLKFALEGIKCDAPFKTAPIASL